MNNTVVLNIVGLTPELTGEHTPFLTEWISKGKQASIKSMLPAVTCSVQSTYLTGVMPDQHGIVGNGWYFREMDEIKFWRQSNKLVQAPKIWEEAKKLDPDFTCANLFWWYNMNSTVDYLITPRPIYRADGVKIPDILTYPADLRDKLQSKLGQFPLFNFWGPKTTIYSSQWIADSAKEVNEMYDPTLTLVYIPHLDYNLQRIGPDDERIVTDLQEIDDLCKDIIKYYEAKNTKIVLLSEYGIASADQPVSLNRTLRKHGYITVREEKGGEILIPGSSRAFAVADHQIAHIYIKEGEDIGKIKRLLEEVPGVDKVLDEEGKKEHHLNHERSGELVAVAEENAWFNYYYWLDDNKAPDFAPTVAIHDKPGYDPAELLIDPKIKFPTLKAGLRLLQKKLGFRYKMDLIPIEDSGIKGTHGRVHIDSNKNPLIVSQSQELIPDHPVDPTDVYRIIKSHIFY
ncbi:MAG: nucleotide pyrophosphatase/phosphodiesterase family protein [Balneolaceae bacterium]